MARSAGSVAGSLDCCACLAHHSHALQPAVGRSLKGTAQSAAALALPHDEQCSIARARLGAQQPGRASRNLCGFPGQAQRSAVTVTATRSTQASMPEPDTASGIG